MNKRISMIVVSVFANSKDIMVYVYRDLEEFPSKAYIINNGFWYKVRYNKILNRLLDSNKIKLAEQRVFVNGNVEMIFVPVSTVKPNPLNEIEFANDKIDVANTKEDLHELGYNPYSLPDDTILKIKEKTDRSDVSYWDALGSAADYFNVPTRDDQDEW